MMSLRKYWMYFLIVMAMGACFAEAQTFTNPTFVSQDPWVTKVNGIYYYSQSYCGLAVICVKSSTTLTGLATAPFVGVWSPSSATDPNGSEVWAPEIHFIDGNWYIYYAADNGSDNNHRIFALQASNPSNPLGAYVEANTGVAHGQVYGTDGIWEIDPDVFTAADGNLYMTFSCRQGPNTSSGVQQICIAGMSSPLALSSWATFISYPDQPWETRSGGPIQEGPVGYAWGNDTYITYSASPSWTTDYAVGVLAHFNDNGGNPDMLNGTWTKYGPILDHHGTAYGPGSVVFVPSVDGSESWMLYHGIDQPNCSPNAYACRDVRMQKIYYTSYGFPVLGYAVNPGVSLTDPAGEHGIPAGSSALPDWGRAFGDAAEGNPAYGTIVGNWTLSTSLAYQATASSSSTGTWNQAFRFWNPNPQNFTVTAQAQWVSDTGIRADYPKYGIYCSYDDVNNHAELMIDKYYGLLASHAVVGGVDQGWQNANLPSGFDSTQWHTLQCAKSGSTYTFTLDPGTINAISYSRSLNLINGQVGVITDDTQANFRDVTTTQ